MVFYAVLLVLMTPRDKRQVGSKSPACFVSLALL